MAPDPSIPPCHCLPRADDDLKRETIGSTPEEKIEDEYLAAVYRFQVYNENVTIQSFSDKEVEEFFVHGRLKKGIPWRENSRVVRRKLDMLHFAAELGDLISPPGNRLEALKGRLAGFHSIRINDQWRVIFVWTRLGPEQVRIVDYHD